MRKAGSMPTSARTPSSSVGGPGTQGDMSIHPAILVSDKIKFEEVLI